MLIVSAVEGVQPPRSLGNGHGTLPDMDLGQRKTVTVLFSDLVDSTAMTEQIDPEALAEVLSRYFDSMRSVIERHGGTVEKFIGDAVVGMFGVPQVHEDDALRAVQAALAMQTSLESIKPDFERRHGLRLAARIGINTGEVAVSNDDSRSGGQIALGHAINMAARLEQSARPGEVLIGASTHEIVRSFVTAEPAGPLTVKGSSVPVEAWRVTSADAGGRRGWSAGPFVGRRKELSALHAAFSTASAERVCVVATVVAPPGLGKSRLAAELVRTIADRARVLVGRCIPYGEGATYAPLVDMVAADDLPADLETVQRARQSVSYGTLASPEETAWIFKQLLETLSEERPVVAVVDDIHWAEPLLLDLLEYVASFSVDRPILLLCLARPELFDSRPEWSAPRQHGLTIRLEPLTNDEAEVLLAGATDVDAATRDRIVEAAAGVPLFVEQMAALGSEWEGNVPPTVRAVLAARIDRLHKSERTLLERAAIQGELFDRATVARLLGNGGDTPLGGTLMRLVRREFVRPESSAHGGERFRFNHALLRDAVYDQMSRRLRSQLHERYADLLASDGEGDPQVIGHHLERAYAERAAMGADADTAKLSLRAGRALHEAGRRALARKEWQHARQVLERARPLLGQSPSQIAVLLPDLLQALGELGDLDRATAVHAEAVAAAHSLADISTELRADIEWAQLQMRHGNAQLRERVPEIAQRAEEHFARIGDYTNLASALLLKVTSPGMSIADKIEILREAQVHAQRAGDERRQIEIWDELGGSMIFGPTPYPEILEFMRREVEWARDRGIAFAEADGSLGVAYALAATGDTEAAREAVARVRALFAELPGFVSQLGESDILGASIEADVGNPEAAERLYRRAMDVLERGGHVPWWMTAAIGLAGALIDLQRADEAGDVLAAVDRRGFLWSTRAKASYLQARAKLAAARGDLTRALSQAREAVDSISDADSPQYAARAHELLGDLLRLVGDADHATAELEGALELYGAKAYRPGEERVLNKRRSPRAEN
jgi:class 3 adenylate cyclase/tetratricopeptide (TPR) repeat protein